jgi:branched-chain amino acid aminotransferase
MSTLPFDQREGKIWLDGKMVDWQDAKTHVLTHGLHYGSSVFEGERAYGGEIFKSVEHSERFHNSANILGFEIPYNVEALEAAKAQVMQANNIVDGYLRPVAWRGSEMMAIAAKKGDVHVAICAWDWPSMFKPEIKKHGIRMHTARYKRPSPETAPCASKAAGLYMICTISKHEAEAAGYHDALMLDYRGYLAEATGANLFLVIDGDLHTPTPDCFLDGITRRTVIALAKERGIKVIERHMKPEELARASEVFITGTAAEITPVGEIDAYKFTVGPVTNALMDAYHSAVYAHQKAAA